MRDILITLIIFGSIPVILRHAWTGILVFSWISYMNPHRLAWGFAYDMPFAAIVAATTLFACLFSRDLKPLPRTPLIYVWILWTGWMCVTTIFALEPEWARDELVRSLKIQFMVFFSIALLQDPRRIMALVWILVISIGFYGVKGGFFVLATGGSYRVWGPPGTFFAGTNPLALTLLMTIPLMYFLRQETTKPAIRWSLLAAILLTAFAVVSTYSRGAFVAGAAVSCYLLLKLKNRFLIAPVLLVILAGVLSFMPVQYFDRIETILHYEEDESAMGRISAWIVATRLALDRPLVGGGFQVMSPALFEKYLPEALPRDVHSIYFEVLGEQGFVGLFLFLGLMWLAMRTGKKVRRRTNNNTELRWAYNLATALQVSIVAYAVGGAFLGLAYFDLYYHLIGSMVITDVLVHRHLSSAANVHEEPRSSPASNINGKPSSNGPRSRRLS